MDHVDWLDGEHAQEVANTLAKQVVPGGIVIWRSASNCPPYADTIARAGFEVTRLQVGAGCAVALTILQHRLRAADLPGCAPSCRWARWRGPSAVAARPPAAPQVAKEGYMDRVNMYSSFYKAVRKGGKKDL
jgi:hypothetical protein